MANVRICDRCGHKIPAYSGLVVYLALPGEGDGFLRHGRDLCDGCADALHVFLEKEGQVQADG